MVSASVAGVGAGAGAASMSTGKFEQPPNILEEADMDEGVLALTINSFSHPKLILTKGNPEKDERLDHQNDIPRAAVPIKT